MHSTPIHRPPFLLCLALAALFTGCGAVTMLQRQVYAPDGFRALPQDIVHEKSPVIKAHMRDGRLYVLSAWSLEDSGRVLRCRGRQESAGRTVIDSGDFSLPVDSVALFETNVATPSGWHASLMIMTVVSGAITAACISNPKACFGSCPTFYAGRGKDERLVAEGFSSSVLPSLEATDVDALPDLEAEGGRITLTMRNEAYETHAVRSVRLVAVPRPAGTRVYRTPDGVYEATRGEDPPLIARGSEGDCTEPLSNDDGAERCSATDSADLGTKECIDLVFAPSHAAHPALIVSARQSLASTFLFYSTLACMGREAGRFLAAQESSPALRGASMGAVRELIGSIAVLQCGSDGGWKVVGQTGEIGPLARETMLIPLQPSQGDTLRVRLEMTRGFWRIDRAAATAVEAEAAPRFIEAEAVVKNGRPDGEALGMLRDSTQRLASMPGDEFTISFRRPADLPDCQYFLESRGYYIEWIREQWMQDDNPALAALIAVAPREFLRVMAPKYKAVEADMERSFWSSRYGKH
jgi:hypothetical protein